MKVVKEHCQNLLPVLLTTYISLVHAGADSEVAGTFIG